MEEDEAFATGRSSRAAVNLDVGALAETGHGLFDLLQSLEWLQPEVLNSFALLATKGDWVVAILHSLFCVAAIEYADVPGNL